MSESKQENLDLPPKSKPQDEHEFAMDFDIGLGSIWPLDHISLVSNPMSPFLLSTISEQPFSPVWAFSDVDDEKNIRTAASGNFNTIAENTVENDDNNKTESPLVALPTSENPDGCCLIKERMTQALRQFKELSEQNVLAQFWAPVRNGNRYALTTSGQPFVLDPHSNGLHQYRTVSLMYLFSVDGENDEILGLPGRVFQHKVPEWTPNVQYYTSKEYQRLNHAQHYNVHGTLALPVFELEGQSCVAVLELIMTSQKINYAPEVDKICKALEAVSLRSSEILEHPYNQICNEDRQYALAEILEILTVVCETHSLPLAQTWVPCKHRSVLVHGGGLKKSCSSFDGSCMGQVCMSITEVAYYIIDAHTWGFHEACVEHHLQQGQGVAGRAFLSHNMCFCGNITQFCKTEYPLVHYALMFGLTSCFAMCLQSSHTGDDDYVLEFFLPPRITDFNEQRSLLGSMLATMKPHFQSLKIASGVELEKNSSVEFIEAINERVHLRFESIPITQSSTSPPRHASPTKGEGLPLEPSKQHIIAYFDGINDGGNLSENAGGHTDQNTYLETKAKKKPSERKRGKAEKTISLDVLQHYFTGSLKDAAKSLGVCPTTMKRICRQHGISRWPSRKIKKVNRSLSKLKCVIESVHGADGAFGLTSVSPGSLPIAGSISEPSTSNKFNCQTSLTVRPSEPNINGNDFDAPRVSESNRQAGVEDQFLGARTQSPQKVINDEGGTTQEIVTKGTIKLKTRSGSSSEGSAFPTPHGSCNGSPSDETSPSKDIFVTGNSEKCFMFRGSLGSTLHSTSTPNCATAYSMPNINIVETTEPQEPSGGQLLEGAGSSKDLRNLCPSTDAVFEGRIPEACKMYPQCSDLALVHHVDTLNNSVTPSAVKKMKSVTIKATHKEDIIRFKVSLNCGIEELKEEIAKRLKLEVGTFDIKYLDDDREWVLIACDADLQECMDISRSSGSNIIRLVVHDILSILGSPCERSGYWKSCI